MPAAQIGVNAALAALQNFWDPAPVGTGVQLAHGAHSPEQAAAAQQGLQRAELALQQQYLAQAAPHTWSPIRAAERLDPNVWSHSSVQPGGPHAAPSGAPGGLPMGHGGPPQGAQAAQLSQHAAALLAAYGTCAPESAEVRRRLCHAAGSSACCCAGMWGSLFGPAGQHLLTGGIERTAAGKRVLRAA